MRCAFIEQHLRIAAIVGALYRSQLTNLQMRANITKQILLVAKGARGSNLVYKILGQIIYRCFFPIISTHGTCGIGF